jgi:(1->4)-alpha-D-glucan 1-alpha-D-glucosylmutase
VDWPFASELHNVTRGASTIDLIARAAGLLSGYRNIEGAYVETSNTAKRAVLEGLGLQIADSASARRTLEELRSRAALPLDQIVVATELEPCHISIRVIREIATLEIRVTDESGVSRSIPCEVRRQDGNSVLITPPFERGYYRLSLRTKAAEAATTLIVAPSRCWLPGTLENEMRGWGATTHVYGLRSDDDLGIGDFTLIGKAAEACGKLGASFLGLNPLHALFSADRSRISPYSPSSRLSLEPLYIDTRAAANTLGVPWTKCFNDPHLPVLAAQVRNSNLVDYEGVWRLKREILDHLWIQTKNSPEQATFAQFKMRHGESLARHAAFEALSEHFAAKGLRRLDHWPQPYRDVNSPQVDSFRREHSEPIDFHAWLQWLAEEQLAVVAHKAHESEMEIGLYGDLAVGADRFGSEVWATPERYARQLSIGAPPDQLGPQGQNWGFPPFDPFALLREGLAGFREIVAANMRRFGAIRIDHGFQLKRLFVMPAGQPATLGAYVEYPLEAMLAVLRLESCRAKCVVIAEDLGTRPDGFAESIMHSGILGYRLLPFEREADGSFKSPRAYPRHVIAGLNTHDLPTFAGWCRGLDIDLRECFGLYSRAQADAQRADRHIEIAALAARLRQEGIARSHEDGPALLDAIRFLARTRASLAAIQFEDALQEVQQINLPGPSAGHPNWQRRLSSTVEMLTRRGGPLARIAAAMTEEGCSLRPQRARLADIPPRSTYRLQLNKYFTFEDAAAIVPYLARLGISHIYTSPIQKARTGSMHGYDVVDHREIDPQLGGMAGFLRFSDRLRECGLSLIVDIVPNHMSIGGSDNPWWLSVLEWGQRSPYVKSFDIDWSHPKAKGKLIVPILGRSYREALAADDFELRFDESDGPFNLWYFTDRFPIRLDDYAQIISYILAVCPAGDAIDLARVADAVRADLPRPDAPSRCERHKRQLSTILCRNPRMRSAASQALAMINVRRGVSLGTTAIAHLIACQHYRPTHWRSASSEINYRRFFDINSLAALRIEEPDVFAKVHEIIFRLVRENHIQGLRIDHIDGLADPDAYISALQRELGPGFYIVAEKILESAESLRSWPLAGTTGYDALNQIDGLFVDRTSEAIFDSLYQRETNGAQDYNSQLRAAKREIFERFFGGECERLLDDLESAAEADPASSDLTRNELRQGLIALIAALPVYRTYMTSSTPSQEDVSLIQQARGTIEVPEIAQALDFIVALLLSPDGGTFPQSFQQLFRRKFQQVTAPVMAKSAEDTMFYRYNRFIALNEVGGDPGRFGIDAEEFHARFAQRARNWPHTMLASSTHDTKRAEDARARLLALTGMADEWRAMLTDWPNLFVKADNLGRGELYLLLQSIIGAWPLELLFGNSSGVSLVEFRDRIDAFLVKALRETKRRTSWSAPNTGYEKVFIEKATELLAPNSRFVQVFTPFVRRLAICGILISIARTVLKCTLPGVPDFYQGTEFWDFSLVDPDNRRSVDYKSRMAGVEAHAPLSAMMRDWQHGHLKQHCIRHLLADRRADPDLYAFGSYEPVMPQDCGAQSSIAFRRNQARSALFVVALRKFQAKSHGEDTLTLASETINTGGIFIPRGSWRNLLTASTFFSNGEVPAERLFEGLPVMVLRNSG